MLIAVSTLLFRYNGHFVYLCYFFKFFFFIIFNVSVQEFAIVIISNRFMSRYSNSFNTFFE
jgi:hypothetical protein